MIEATGTRRALVAAVGDVGLIGRGRSRARAEGWDAPFAALRPLLAGADVAFANLEFPVGEASLVQPGRSSEFWHDPEVCAALVRAGFRVVSLANNHLMDCGEEGLRRTLAACREAGLATIGAGADLAAARAPALLPVPGGRSAWLAYSAATADAAGTGRPGVAPLDPEMIREDIARWRRQADVLVVSVHWGSMYVDFPPPRVVRVAAALADAGADLVLGHHPHVVQGAEVRGRALVLYSLGDIAFNCRAGDFHAQVGARRRLESGVFRVTLADTPGLEVRPMTLDDEGFPHVAGPEAGARQLERFAGLSSGLASAAEHFAASSAPQLLRYELDSLGTYLRQGRWDRVGRLLSSVRPRHIPLLWQALRRMGRRA